MGRRRVAGGVPVATAARVLSGHHLRQPGGAAVNRERLGALSVLLGLLAVWLAGVVVGVTLR